MCQLRRQFFGSAEIPEKWTGSIIGSRLPGVLHPTGVKLIRGWENMQRPSHLDPATLTEELQVV